MVQRLLLTLALAAVLPAQAESVATIWDQNCASCHGDKGQGNSAPTLLDDQWATDGSDQALYNATYHGLKDLGMPAYEGGLTEAEAWATVVYIRELAYKKQREEAGDAKPGDDGVYHTDRANFRLETVVQGLDGLDRPWAIDFLPDGRMLVTERSGTLFIMNADGSDVHKIKGTPEVWQRGQGGLLDVGVHPDYAKPNDQGGGWVYLSYSVNTEDNPDRGNTAVARGRLDLQNHRWTDHEVLFRPDPKFDASSGVHFGSRFVFHEGYVYFAVGERGQKEPSQDLESPVGKIHRIHDDGRVPDDNPFTDSPQPTTWTLGHRNPQGLSMSPDTGLLYDIEHAPRGGDEINLLKKGQNYGWPVVSYTINYNGEPFGDSAPFHEPRGFTEPVHYWVPAIAQCGTTFYTGDRFPQWKNDLFVTALAKQELHRVRFTDDGQEVAEDEVMLRGIGRLRDVANAPDGTLYLAAEQPGRIVKLVPAE